MDFLKGTGVALVTPFDSDLSIDFMALERLLDHVVNSEGVDYLVVLGTTGESPTVSWSEKKNILDFVIRNNSKKLPVIFGLGGNNTKDLEEKLEQLDSFAIDAILSASPYYNKPSQEGIFQHYSHLVRHSAFPLILYNVPGRTSSNIEAETTLRLAENSKIIGIKEASGDLMQCAQIASEKPDDFILLSGEDFLTLPILSIGGQGVISVIANYLPVDFSKMVRSALNGDFETARELHLSLLRVFEMLTREGNPASVKAALSSLGILSRRVRLPLVSATDQLEQEFSNWYNEYKR